MQKTRLRFGAFISPIHSSQKNPNLGIHRDLDLVRWLDKLNYDEVWMGEHHSTGWEYVASPEMFLAYAAAQTRRIKLGTGVITLPYHNPFMVAERAVLLDHLCRGRAILGVGSGALPYDADLLGLDPTSLRPRMEESLEVILALLRGERVTKKTEWFSLTDAALQLLPFSYPNLEVAVTATRSPAGAVLAGKFGTSVLSITATQSASATNALAGQWQIAEDESRRSGSRIDRTRWRLVSPMHIAESEKQAREDVAHGIREWVYYTHQVTTFNLVPEKAYLDHKENVDEIVDALVDSGFAVIGTAKQAISQIERLRAASGGFGTFLLWAHDWADRTATWRSFELFAEHVAPYFQGSTESLKLAEADAKAKRAQLVERDLLARKIAAETYESRTRGQI